MKVHTIIYDHKESIISFFWKLNTPIIKMLCENPNIKLIHFNDGLIASLASFHKQYTHQESCHFTRLRCSISFEYFSKKTLPRFNTFGKIITVSHATAQAAIDRGIDRNKIIVINNGVDQKTGQEKMQPLSNLYLKHPKLSQMTKYFITLSRPIKRKGFSWLLKNVIPYVHGNYQLIMIGRFEKKQLSKRNACLYFPILFITKQLYY